MKAVDHIDGNPRNNDLSNLKLVSGWRTAVAVKTDKQKLRLALRALKIADGVMSYCQGDAWERECTEKDRAKFNALYEQLIGKPGEA